MSAVRDMLWLSISDGRVLEVWEDQRRHARRVSRRRQAGDEVTVVQMNRAIWTAAMREARGDAKRIRVLSPTRVEVLVS